jgi:hypothetical protein
MPTYSRCMMSKGCPLRWSLLLVLSAASACSRDCDKLPIVYEVCEVDGGNGKNCQPVARFRSFETCEFFARFYAATCDTTDPQHAQCDLTYRSTTTMSHCTR